MKNRLFLSIILLMFCVVGCSNQKQLDEMSEAIINYHFDYNYDISHLNDYNQELLNTLKFEEKKENKVINITALNMFGEDQKTLEPDTRGVYQKDGIYYIKYEALFFEKINDTDYIATIIANGYEINLLKSNFPVLYDDTQNVNYQYRFMEKREDNDSVKYYYRSYGNGGMLTIEYKLNDGKVKDIELKYDDFYLLDHVDITEEQKSDVLNIIFIVILFGIIITPIILVLKWYDNKKNS